MLGIEKKSKARTIYGGDSGTGGLKKRSTNETKASRTKVHQTWPNLIQVAKEQKQHLVHLLFVFTS